MLFELGCMVVREQPVSAAERQWHRASILVLRATPAGRFFGAGLAVASRDDENEIRDVKFRNVVIRLNDELASEHRAWRNELRRRASHSSPTSRLSRLTPWPQHAKHVAERADEPLLALLPALRTEEKNTALLETLFVSSLSPVWLDEEQIRPLETAGRKQIEALPSNTRMDRASAERLARRIPAPRIDDVPIGGIGRLIGVGRQPTAVAISLALWEVVDAFQPLTDHEGIGGEASMRLGQAYARLARPEQALDVFARVVQRGGTRYEVYLAQLFRGAVLERLGRHADALDAFRGALRAVPRAQSASFALAPLLFQSGGRAEAAEVIEAAVRAPLVVDPLDWYFAGDPQAAVLELARLRQVLR
jgi:tetratricopeptide (TPR) repeat protein